MAGPFSLVRSITAAFRIELSTLKRDAKRLQRATPEVFGQVFPLQKCQEAVARMRGAKSWTEALKSASRAAGEMPTWFEQRHNDAFEAHVAALGTLEVETREDAACVMKGDLPDAIGPALALWAQEMVWRRVPGLVLIDTKKDTVQDTAVGRAAVRLDLADVLHSCRTMDLRQSRCPVALSAGGRDWLNSLTYALGEAHARTLESAGINAALEALLEGLGRLHGHAADQTESAPFLAFNLVKRAVSFARYSGEDIPPELESDHHAASIRHDVKKYLRSGWSSPETRASFDAFCAVVDELDEREFSLGRVFAQESTWRPCVVLFASDDAASSALASVVHAMYYWRYVGHKLRYAGIEPRPVLYVGDRDPGVLPYWLTNSGMARVILAAGAAHAQMSNVPGYVRRSSIEINCAVGFIASSGKKVALSDFLCAPLAGEPAPAA